jgi:hypothetical protein
MNGPAANADTMPKAGRSRGAGAVFLAEVWDQA